MDTPVHEIKWLMRIHQIHLEAEAKARTKAEREAGGR